MEHLRDGTTVLTVTPPATADDTGSGDAGTAGRGIADRGTAVACTAAGGPAGTGTGPRPAGRAVPLEVAASLRARTRGLLGRDGIDGAILLTPANSVHTFRMRFPIDVAYLSRDFRVLAVRTMRPGRLGLPRFRARHVLEAEAGAMREWGLVRGGRVRIG
ncbi:DUF192 domain-containing protein [Streptomyces xinghaiensis]|uniref:DUF192 domain-containing protein n=1 Tax=Streptomyces xinghaiensis TaxID=1038928 RepID=A0A3R7J1J3_9ACTN|nr:DUF192 domain-containing protein [Streptomyces xinghaiensis]RKM93956.1 DUF192 domain-containing protein [Streptomyces xinghaiensis]RNC69459.1 DUF192 domain-containing protein [Streptomyces xinghaiensis]